MTGLTDFVDRLYLNLSPNRDNKMMEDWNYGILELQETHQLNEQVGVLRICPMSSPGPRAFF
jgi:hypothetical protein